MVIGGQGRGNDVNVTRVFYSVTMDDDVNIFFFSKGVINDENWIEDPGSFIFFFFFCKHNFKFCWIFVFVL